MRKEQGDFKSNETFRNENTVIEIKTLVDELNNRLDKSKERHNELEDWFEEITMHHREIKR